MNVYRTTGPLVFKHGLNEGFKSSYMLEWLVEVHRIHLDNKNTNFKQKIK